MIGLIIWSPYNKALMYLRLTMESLFIISIFSDPGEWPGEADGIEDVQEEDVAVSGTDPEVPLAGHHQKLGQTK